VARGGPPAYAWDWFARQRLLWREVRTRLSQAAAPAATRYHAVETRSDVLALLRADYPRDPVVREAVHTVVAEVAFLGRTEGRFSELGIRNPPRGLTWWWAALTGEDTTSPHEPAPSPPIAPPTQLQLDDVHQGWGG
jgi:hypothetical protein